MASYGSLPRLFIIVYKSLILTKPVYSLSNISKIHLKFSISSLEYYLQILNSSASPPAPSSLISIINNLIKNLWLLTILQLLNSLWINSSFIQCINISTIFWDSRRLWIRYDLLLQGLFFQFILINLIIIFVNIIIYNITVSIIIQLLILEFLIISRIPIFTWFINYPILTYHIACILMQWLFLACL